MIRKVYDLQRSDVIASLQVKGCELYVADRYIGWQEATLNFLASQFDAKTRGFPPTWVKEVTEAVKASGKAGDMNDKALKHTIIPFAKVKVDEAQKGGAQARILFHSVPAPTCTQIRLYHIFFQPHSCCNTGLSHDSAGFHNGSMLRSMVCVCRCWGSSCLLTRRLC